MPNHSAAKLPLPETVPVAFVVFCSPKPHQVVSSDTLRPWVRPWVQAHVNEPLRDLILPFLELPMVQIQMTPQETFPPEFVSQLTALLDGAQQQAVAGATHCVTVRCEDLSLFPRVGLWTCLAAALACSWRLGGVIVDVDTRCPFPTHLPFERFHVRGLPRLRYFLALPMSKAADQPAYLTTQGLARFGLPELQLPDVPLMDYERLIDVVCGVCQVLAALVMSYGQDPSARPPTLDLPLETVLTAAYVQLANGPAAGDAGGEARLRLEMRPGRYNLDASFLTLLPPDEYAGEHGVWLHDLVNTFFAPEQTIVPIAQEEAIEQAHRRALAEMPRIKQRFQNGEVTAERLIVKSGFPTPQGEPEYMWVMVRAWQDDEIQGTLLNAPQACPNLRMGQTVTLRDADLYDWILREPDGPVEGGYTEQIVREGVASAPTGEGRPENAEIRRRYREHLDRLYQSQPEPRRGLLGRLLAPSPSPAEAALRTRRYHLAEQGELVTAFVVQANRLLLQPGKDDAPCLALINFDGRDEDTGFMTGLMVGLSALKGTSPAEPYLQAAAALVTDEKYVPDFRRRVPPELTGGRLIYAVHLYVRRDYLPGGILGVPLLSCLATPGDRGMIEMTPYSLVQD